MVVSRARSRCWRFADKTYRKKSLLIHPDKLKHPRGIEAFDLLKKVRALPLPPPLSSPLQLTSAHRPQASVELNDPKKRKSLDETIFDARMLVLREQGLAPVVPDDHEKLVKLKDPPLRERVRKKIKEILIDDELRRRR